jgi:hypothetical protein
MSNVIPFPTKPKPPTDLFDDFVLEITSKPEDSLTVFVLIEFFPDGKRKMLMAHDDIETISAVVERVQELQPHREFIIQPVVLGADDVLEK